MSWCHRAVRMRQRLGICPRCICNPTSSAGSSSTPGGPSSAPACPALHRFLLLRQGMGMQSALAVAILTSRIGQESKSGARTCEVDLQRLAREVAYAKPRLQRDPPADANARDHDGHSPDRAIRPLHVAQGRPCGQHLQCQCRKEGKAGQLCSAARCPCLPSAVPWKP